MWLFFIKTHRSTFYDVADMWPLEDAGQEGVRGGCYTVFFFFLLNSVIHRSSIESDMSRLIHSSMGVTRENMYRFDTW